MKLIDILNKFYLDSDFLNQGYTEGGTDKNSYHSYIDNFYELCEINYLTRVVHHHTFNIELVEQMFSYSGFQNIASYIHNFYGMPLNIVNLSIVKNDNY